MTRALNRLDAVLRLAILPVQAVQEPVHCCARVRPYIRLRIAVENCVNGEVYLEGELERGIVPAQSIWTADGGPGEDGCLLLLHKMNLELLRRCGSMLCCSSRTLGLANLTPSGFFPGLVTRRPACDLSVCAARKGVPFPFLATHDCKLGSQQIAAAAAR